MTTIAERLAFIAERDHGTGLEDLGVVRAHYAKLGVDVNEIVEACIAYLGPHFTGPRKSLAISLAGRMYEIGYTARPELETVVWRCPECGLLSESGGTVPHRPNCSLRLVNKLKLTPAYKGVRA